MSLKSEISDLIERGTSLIDMDFKDRYGYGYLLQAAIVALKNDYLKNEKGIYRGKCENNNILVAFPEGILENHPEIHGFVYEISVPFQNKFKNYSFNSPAFTENNNKLVTTFHHPTYLVHTSKDQSSNNYDILYQETSVISLIIQNPRMFINLN